MGKKLYIAEKPSVAQEFAKALNQNFSKRDGYTESGESIVTWCVGHLVTMSYPEAYDPALKRWSFDTIPFMPKKFKYEIIPGVSKQFNIVRELLNRNDVDCIYVCTDSGREGEYIYRLVDMMSQVPASKERRRVWIDSQTEEEILRGIREAKPLTAYDNLSDAAYLRAKEDYLMGINFSRVLTLKYGNAVKDFLKSDRSGAISVGRVMTCVLGMVVRREREIRLFVKTSFYRVVGRFGTSGTIEGEFRAAEGSRYFGTPALYKENGFKSIDTARELINFLMGCETDYTQTEENNRTILTAVRNKEQEIPKALIQSIEKKKENKNAPLLFNLAELQNECSKLFKISPDETLKIAQELYEKKLVTYPRTDARVLSTAVAKEISKNIAGLGRTSQFHEYAEEILGGGLYKGIAKTRYVNDKQITDHYAIIPTGQGLSALSSLGAIAGRVYELIGRRFLSIFYPPAVYRRISLVLNIRGECFFAGIKVLMDEGYLKVAGRAKQKTGTEAADSSDACVVGEEQLKYFEGLKKGMLLDVNELSIREGETSPPKRYASGSLILAMENAGQLIEDEELRAQIKGSGIGTSATRAEILNKLVKIGYLSLNKKTQTITPTLMGEMIFDVVSSSIRALLNPDLTASWEKGLTYVSEGSITSEEYLEKLEGFVSRLTNGVKSLNNQSMLNECFNEAARYYKTS